MKAIAYTRCSTEGQAEDGVSLAVQRDKVETYAKLYGLEIVAIFEDGGRSGKSLDRIGLREALGALTDGRAEALLVAKLDRLTRSVRDLGELLAEYFAPGRFQLLSVMDQIDTRSASGRLSLNILVSVSQWEREIIVERTTHAMAHKKSHGERVGTLPYGWRLAADGVHLEADPVEQGTAELIGLLSARGMSVRAIVERLNTDGVPARASSSKHRHHRTEPSWNVASVHKIIVEQRRGKEHEHRNHGASRGAVGAVGGAVGDHRAEVG